MFISSIRRFIILLFIFYSITTFLKPVQGPGIILSPVRQSINMYTE